MATTHPLPKFSMPKDFPSILKDFAREVLRSQPVNVYEFAAKYFDDQLKARASGTSTTAGAEKADPALAVRRTEGMSENRRSGGFSVVGVRHRTSEDMFNIIENADVEIVKSSPQVKIPACRIAMVCDGHGGVASAEFVSQQLWRAIVTSPNFSSDVEGSLKEAFKLTDETLVSHLQELVGKATPDSGNPSVTGCCTVSALVMDGNVWVANLGDSRCLLIQKKPGDNKATGIPLSRDQKVTDPEESKRLADCGAVIRTNRLLGVLAVARSFGDFEIKKMSKDAKGIPALLNEPDIRKHPIEEGDICLILASDGLWDVLSNEDAADICSKALEESGGNPKRACEALVTSAAQKDSDDDITALVLLLP